MEKRCWGKTTIFVLTHIYMSYIYIYERPIYTELIIYMFCVCLCVCVFVSALRSLSLREIALNIYNVPRREKHGSNEQREREYCRLKRARNNRNKRAKVPRIPYFFQATRKHNLKLQKRIPLSSTVSFSLTFFFFSFWLTSTMIN